MEAVDRISEMSVNAVCSRWPETVEVFNRHGIDACCGGAERVPLAAERDGANVEVVMAELVRIVEGES